MDSEQNNPKTGFTLIVPFEPHHPEMLIKFPERDRRFDTVNYCEYCINNESYD